MAEEITLDVCDLEPPGPYESATAALREIKHGQYLRLIIPRQPRLLYPWLDDNKFDQFTQEISEDLFEIYIWNSDDTDTGKEIYKLLD